MKQHQYYFDVPLGLQFKGDRDYLQGGDIYTALCEAIERLKLPEDSFISKLAFRRFARLACRVTSECPVDHSTIVAEGLLKLGSHLEINFWVLETQHPISGRYEFDEQLINAKALFDSTTFSVTLNNKTQFRTIEEIICLTKHLHLQAHPKEVGKWVFGKIDLRCKLPEEYHHLRIEQSKRVGNVFSINEVFIDTNHLGSINFISVRL